MTFCNDVGAIRVLKLIVPIFKFHDLSWSRSLEDDVAVIIFANNLRHSIVILFDDYSI